VLKCYVMQIFEANYLLCRTQTRVQPELCIYLLSSLLFNDAFSIQTIESDVSLINEYGARWWNENVRGKCHFVSHIEPMLPRDIHLHFCVVTNHLWRPKCVQLRLVTVLGKSSTLIRDLTMVFTRPNYTSGQDDVPTRTEERLCVRSKTRHEADRDERLASWLQRARATILTTRICYITCYITHSAPLVYTRLKVWTIFAARTLGSWVRIPLEPWISVCVYSVCVVLCVGRGIATGCKSGKAQQRAVEPNRIEWIIWVSYGSALYACTLDTCVSVTK
jgi:hypothetical protein